MNDALSTQFVLLRASNETCRKKALCIINTRGPYLPHLTKNQHDIKVIKLVRALLRTSTFIGDSLYNSTRLILFYMISYKNKIPFVVQCQSSLSVNSWANPSRCQCTKRQAAAYTFHANIINAIVSLFDYFDFIF